MKRKAGRLDAAIIVILLCFMAISTLVIDSATSGTRFEGLHVNNLIMYGLSMAAMLAIALVDYRIAVRYLSFALYGVGIGLLLLVHFNGTNLNGSTRWISLAGVQFQPSEFVKLFVILAIARWLARRNGEPLRFRRDIVPVLLLTAAPMLLILMQPDLGTAIVFVGILVAMLWMANMRWTHLLAGCAALAAVAVSLVGLYATNHELLAKIVKPHQMARIQAFLDPASDPDKSWHVLNAMRAIGTGELYGKGFRQGTMVQNGYIPYDYADSIFVVIGEEFGFLGSAALLLLYFLLIYRMVQIAYDCRDVAGSYIVIGVISVFILQIFENIAMHLGLMPLTGIALPFISYGGSSLMTNMAAVGLVLSVKIHHDSLRLP